jgi:phospholipid transport system substrate-binding protein
MRSLILVCFFILSTIPALADGDQPIEVLQKGVEEGLRVLQDSKYKGAELKEAQQQKLGIVLQQLFDFREFSRRVLASNWKIFSPHQRKAFVSVFTEFLSKFYLGKLQEKYKDETLIYVGQELKTPTRALVNVQVVWKGQKIPVDLRMVKRKGLWKVYDIQVLGISAVRNYRAQFKSLLSKETPAQVIERMKERIRKIDSKKQSSSVFKNPARLTLCTQREYISSSSEVVSKPHLVSDGCVANRLKMLTYYRVCCAFDSACALPSNTI